MNEPLSRLRSLASGALGTSPISDLDSKLLALLKQLAPLLRMAGAKGGFSALLDDLSKPGTTPRKPIKAKHPGEPVWVQAPVSIDITNLSQDQVDVAISSENIEAVGTRSSKVTFPAP